MEKKGFPIGISGNALKIIAMLAMFIDHAAFQFVPWSSPWYMPLRMIGRLAFPIFAFMIAEGCVYTRNRARYLGMIFGLGAICQIAYTVAMKHFYMGILMVFSLSIATIYCIDGLKAVKRTLPRCLLVLALAGIAFIVLFMPSIFAKQGFDLDYGTLGFLLPIVLYYLHKDRWPRLIALTAILIGLSLVYRRYQFYALFTVPLLALYNGKRGKWKLKYLFYVFYPAHLAFIYLLAILLQQFA